MLTLSHSLYRRWRTNRSPDSDAVTHPQFQIPQPIYPCECLRGNVCLSSTARAGKKFKSAMVKWRRIVTRGNATGSWRIQDGARHFKNSHRTQSRYCFSVICFLPASNGVQLRADTFLRHSQEGGRRRRRRREREGGTDRV